MPRKFSAASSARAGVRVAGAHVCRAEQASLALSMRPAVGGSCAWHYVDLLSQSADHAMMGIDARCEQLSWNNAISEWLAAAAASCMWQLAQLTRAERTRRLSNAGLGT